MIRAAETERKTNESLPKMSLLNQLRTALPFATAHAFCASQDVQRNATFLRKQNKFIFAQFMTMREKQILARIIGIQKRKLGVTTNFSEITMVQFGEKMPYIVDTLYGCILQLFRIIAV